MAKAVEKPKLIDSEKAVLNYEKKIINTFK
jgi:hypothetical protein